MEASKFGSFLAQLRKEQNMTQSELANKLQVTDKAVSRWERGIGLPDISTLEPLSDALHVTVLELLRSERIDHQDIPFEAVSEAVIDTIRIAADQQKSLKKRILTILLTIMFSLSGCKNVTASNQYNIDGISYITYTDIDSVCDSHELTVVGKELLSSLEEQLLLSFVVDSSISLTEELGEYDHLILTNPQWIERFGDLDKLKSVKYDSLSNRMQEFLTAQMPIFTVDESILPDGIGLYRYDHGKLLAFPVNVTLGAAKPIEAQNPLIILVDKPAQMLDAHSCMLPLTSSGNVLFADGNKLQAEFAASDLNDYGTVHQGLENGIR